MLDDARDAGDPHFIQRVGAVATIIENQSFFSVDSVHEVGSEAHRESHHTNEVSRRRIVLDMAGLHLHGAEKTQIVRRGHKYICVVMHAGPLRRRCYLTIREANTEERLLI